MTKRSSVNFTILIRVLYVLAVLVFGASPRLAAAAGALDTSMPSRNITFEDGSLVHPVTGVSRVSGNVVLDNTSLIKGVYSAVIRRAESAYLQENFPDADEVYVSFYMKLNALPADDVRIA